MVNDRQTDADFAALLCALSFATGLGFGDHMEHGLRTAYLGLRIADALTLTNEEHEAIFYGALLKDVTCPTCSAIVVAFLPDEKQMTLSDALLMDTSNLSDITCWLSRYIRQDIRSPSHLPKLLSFLAQAGPIARETMRGHCEVAELFARQLGFPDYVQQTLRFQWERWDGKGMAYRVKGPAIPRTARILYLAQVLELMYHFTGPEATQALAQEKRGTRFDPEAVDAFLTLTQQTNFWSNFEEQSTQEALLARRPTTAADCAQADQIERVCETLADFVDLKSRENWHHSRTVAEVAVGIGTALGMKTGELTKLRRAALIHDIGKVAIPASILAKGERLSNSERETYRLHVYYTQRILEQVAPLQELALAASTHHEWINGQGYHRRLRGEQIPFHGRILAVADSYARLLQQRDQTDPTDVLSQMRTQVGTQFDSTCYEALVTSLTQKQSLQSAPPRSRKTGDLTEREIEVLRLLAQGHNTPQISLTLHISKKTVEHHLSHIYNKIGVTCRTAAVIYAVQQGIV